MRYLKFKDFILENKSYYDTYEVGTFEIISGDVIVSDPCYDFDVDQVLSNVKTGTWKAYVKISMRDENRCSELIAIHSDYELKDMRWEQSNVGVGVDSGQAGIYDVEHYKDDSVIDFVPKYKSARKESSNPWFILIDEYGEKGFYELIKDQDKFHKELKRVEKEFKPRIEVREWDCTVRENEPGSKWYAANSARTLNFKNDVGFYDSEEEVISQEGGVIPFGCVAHSGYGDGGYPCEISYEDGERRPMEDPYGEERWGEKIIGIRIIYIEED